MSRHALKNPNQELPAQFTKPPANSPEAVASAERRGKGGPGRTVGLTPRIQEIICDAIAAGNYQKVAARAAGISEETLKKWRARGRRGIEPLYVAFEEAIEKANRDCEMTLVAKVMAATDEDWRAAMTMLERKYPERWSKVREQAALETGAAAAVFQITFHLEENQWDAQIEERRLELARRAATTNPSIDVTPPPAPPVRDPDPNLN